MTIRTADAVSRAGPDDYQRSHAPLSVPEPVIERARRGDRSAQAALIGELEDVWYRFCVSVLGNPDLARDAVQESALRFLQRLPSYRGDSTVQTWALGIALNVCREVRRGRGSPPLPPLAKGGRTAWACIVLSKRRPIGSCLRSSSTDA